MIEALEVGHGVEAWSLELVGFFRRDEQCIIPCIIRRLLWTLLTLLFDAAQASPEAGRAGKMFCSDEPTSSNAFAAPNTSCSLVRSQILNTECEAFLISDQIRCTTC